MVFNATFSDISVISSQKTKKLHNQPWWPSSIINGPNTQFWMGRSNGKKLTDDGCQVISKYIRWMHSTMSLIILSVFFQ